MRLADGAASFYFPVSKCTRNHAACTYTSGSYYVHYVAQTVHHSSSFHGTMHDNTELPAQATSPRESVMDTGGLFDFTFDKFMNNAAAATHQNTY